MTGRELERRALALFSELVDLPEAERAAAVSRLSEGDTALESRLLEMLKADAEPSVLPTEGDALVPRVALPTESLSRPERVGAYQITERIGQGGMGVVYKAERADGRFDRTVAVKLVNVGWVSDELRARFENERRIAARLEHPHIARLIDGGEVEGRPYIVMEYVEGAPIRSDANQRRRQLEQFAQICDAVDYAHNNLVLHRDIKPGNVMITPDGDPKLLDFGIAKLEEQMLDDPALTQAGGPPMTPAYTAPECLAGEPATVRSEVYSLGALLYELLHDRPPFDLAGVGLVEAHRTVSRADALSVSTGSSDLDVIVSVAMHREPTRRYASAAALANDVRAMLSGRAIDARRDEMGYLFRRFVARNKVAVGASALGIVALVAGLTVSTLAYFEAERARAEAESQQALAEGAVTFLGTTLIGANPHSGLGRDATIEDALSYAEQELDARFSESPEAKVYLLTSLASVYAGRSQPKKAFDYAARAAALADGSDGGWAFVSDWVDAAVVASEFDQGLEWANRGVEFLRGQGASGRGELANVLAGRGDLLVRVGRVEEARQDGDEALAIFDTLEQPSIHNLAKTLGTLATVDFQEGRSEDSIAKLDRALELMRSIGRENFPNALQARMNRATALANLQRWDASNAAFESTLADMETVLGPNHQWVLWGAASYGLNYQRQGKIDRGVEVMQDRLDRALATDTFPEHDETIAYLRAKLGFTQCSGDYDQAGLENLELALASRRALFAPDYWGIGDVLGAIGVCLTGLERFEDAEAALLEALEIYLSVFGPDHVNTGSVRRWLVGLYEAWARPELADRYRA